MIKLPVATKRLILDDFVPDDAAALAGIAERLVEQAAGDPDYKPFWWFHLKDGETMLENMRKRIAGAIEASKATPRVNYSLAVRLRENNVLIGRFGIDMDGIGDTGGFTDPPHQRRGYQSELRIAMLDLYFERFDELTATAGPENRPSIANLISFGGVLSGTKESSVWDGGARNIYKISKEAYQKARAKKMAELR